jgi:hypothetical protein
MMHFFRDINIEYNIFFILRQTSKEFDSSKCIYLLQQIDADIDI